MMFERPTYRGNILDILFSEEHFVGMTVKASHYLFYFNLAKTCMSPSDFSSVQKYTARLFFNRDKRFLL